MSESTSLETPGEQTLEQAATEEGDKRAPLTGERIAEIVTIEEQRADEPEQADDLQDDPDTVACPACGGFGETKTGSYVPEHITRQCPTCLGAGFLEKTQAQYYHENRRQAEAATQLAQ